ncbi:MAG TPA: ATP-binding protein [Ramlibacter sp.]|uniref:sensor histidine kinase n=1 Tax=Ramlibacter sp. TaxID=1917967 RepID=UPI002D80CD95|nr:ATP-binding protein [Ramlibacter sp.]HET8745622.1 ATP-binding protein [Ramlibacter sp.]
MAPNEALALGGGTAVLAAALVLALALQLWRQSRSRKRTEQRFRQLSNAVPQIVFVADRRGQVQFVSTRWVEVTGLRRREALGEAWQQALHPDERAEIVQRLREMVRRGEPLQVELRLRADGGSYRWHLLRAAPLDEDGRRQAASWLGTLTDIDALKQAQEQTRLQAEEIRRLNAGLEERIAERTAQLRLANTQLAAFSYSVSHDLQSPLQRVSSYAKLLQQELAAAPEGRAQHYLARIQGNADTMAQLIEGLLALAHVSEVEIIRSAVNLSDLASEILQRLQAEQPQRSVAWQVQPGLAATGDVRLMRSVMENLLGNAWKFTARAPAPEIVVGGDAARGEYFVRDTGCGFDMAYADRLFGTFQRLHAEHEYPGTGIGLATVARAISRQGGRIWAESAPGQGATFRFTLPPA